MKRFVPFLLGILLLASCADRPKVVRETLDTDALTCVITC